jgi:hypothetical protein
MVWQWDYLWIFLIMRVGVDHQTKNYILHLMLLALCLHNLYVLLRFTILGALHAGVGRAVAQTGSTSSISSNVTRGYNDGAAPISSDKGLIGAPAVHVSNARAAGAILRTALSHSPYRYVNIGATEKQVSMKGRNQCTVVCFWFSRLFWKFLCISVDGYLTVY